MFIDFIKATVVQTVNAPLEIRHLVQQLPAIYKNCKTNNTIKKHQQYLTRGGNGQPTLMSFSCQVTRFIWDSTFFKKMQARHSQPTIDATFFAIKVQHTSLLNNDPCQHSLVKNMFQASNRLSNHKTKKEQAPRLNKLKQIYDHLSANQSSLENLQLPNITLSPSRVL